MKRLNILIGGGKKFLPRLVAVAIAAASGHAIAQNDTESKGAQGALLEEIEVVGQRLANQRAIATKRESIRVVDALAVDDIGSLPDFNVGEAVQRLPGITIKYDQAEARFISIRALNPDYNYMTIDGVSMAVPDRNGRNPYMDTLPSSLAGKIEVIKSLTPDLEGSGIGGQVNIVSRSAFEFDDTFFKATAQIGYYDQNDGFEENDRKSGIADFVYADQFGDEDQFGVVVTGNYYKRDSYVPKTYYGNTRKWLHSDGSQAGVYEEGAIGPIPDYRYWPYYRNNRERQGLSGKLEYRPTDSASFMIRSYWNTAQDDEARQSDFFFTEKAFNDDVSVAADGTITGSATGKRRIYLGQFDFTRDVWGTVVQANVDFDNGHQLEASINNSGSLFENPERWNRWETDKEIAYDYVFDAVGRAELIPQDPVDLSLFKPVHQNRLDDRKLEEDINEIKLDYGYNNDGFGQGWGFKVGLKYRNTDREFDESKLQYEPVDKSTVGFTFADNDLLNIGPCFSEGCAADGVGVFEIDSSAVWAAFQAELAENPDDWTFVQNEADQLNKDYSLDEDVFAGYGMLTHTGDSHFLVFGVRYEKTDWEGQGFREDEVNGWGKVKNGGDYTNVLPSANFSYELREDLKLRLAYSHAIGRVPFNRLAPVGESIDDTEIPIKIERSNPDLDPRQSRNIDASLEWYLDDGEGILSAGVFHKVLKDEILEDKQTFQIEFEGQLVEAEAEQYINAGDDITIKGVEVNFVKNLNMLPPPFNGLGISANATWTDTDFKIATAETAAKSGYFKELGLLKDQADETYNAAVFYESGKFSARLAYNRTGIVLRSINISDPWRSYYETPREKYDFKATYHVNEHFDLSLDIWNLTNDIQTTVFGRDQEILRNTAEYGQAWFLSVGYKM